MPCQFSLGYVSQFMPASTLGAFSQNAFGHQCQFNFPDGDLIEFDGKSWCPFHLPLANAAGMRSEKNEWDFTRQAYYSGLLSHYINARHERQEPIDLCGLIHWDRLTFSMQYSRDASVATSRSLTNIPAISLDGAYFPRGADFSRLRFAQRVYFRNVFFGDQANFMDTQFDDEADFSGSVFKGEALFASTSFQKIASFCGARFHQNMLFLSATFFEDADFSLHSRWNHFLSIHTAEESISSAIFCDAAFHGASLFNDRQFLSGPDFSRSTFYIAPAFHNAKFHQSASFDGAAFSDTSSDSAARSYRTLKLAMEGLGARDEQAMFFALEQQSRAKKPWTPVPVKLFSRLYGLISNYGQDFVRPLLVLVLVALLFCFTYTIILMFINDGLPSSFTTLLGFTLEQMVRPFGIWAPDYPARVLRATGSVTDAPILLLRLAATLHTLLSVGLVALSLLALRRRFKLD